MKAKCTRGFGRVEDPQTGEEITVEGVFDVSETVFERLDDAYPGMERVNDRDEAGATDTEDTDTAEEHSSETETFRCGVNDCSREVDNPDATCWQHDSE